MKAAALTLLLTLALSLPAKAQEPIYLAAGNITNSNSNIAAGDQTITFTKPSSAVTIILSSGSSDIYLNLNNTTATTSHALIPGGTSYTYVGFPISGFHYYGGGTTGTISVIAH